MIKLLRKELIIYTTLLAILIVAMHPDMLSSPTERLALMHQYANYIHPLLYTFSAYLILFFVRSVIAFMVKFLKKENRGNSSRR